MLPQDCVSQIFYFMSPLDACRSTAVSSVFRSAMESDSLWERFLPSTYPDILVRAVTPLKFSSKKELFLLLCNPVLIDGGRKSFKLEKSSGKESYILSARELSIPWSDVPSFWCWIPTNESRFAEVAVLRATSWLEIKATIETKALSPDTAYEAYLILKISDRAFGLDSVPSKTSVEVGSQFSSDIAYICNQKLNSRSKDENAQIPRERKDGWMEIKLGEFLNDQGHEEVKMSFMEVTGYQLKGGLSVQGIEVRPKQIITLQLKKT